MSTGTFNDGIEEADLLTKEFEPCVVRNDEAGFFELVLKDTATVWSTCEHWLAQPEGVCPMTPDTRTHRIARLLRKLYGAKRVEIIVGGGCMSVHPAYKINGPALVSFSGGRTSAYMLHQILAAHDGKLPDDVHVVFANTGKEREETLQFVHECAVRWGVTVRWVEWRDTEAGYEEVGINSASRSGEPFAALIAKRGFVPNGVSRFCSVTLKVRAARNFVRAELGWKRWSNAIGLRYDEGHRVLKALARNDTGKDPFRAIMPMAKAKATIADVSEFWARQPFDLGLRSYEGNCDLCFLKSRGKLLALIRENPGMVDWWIEQENRVADTATSSGATFRLGEPFQSIADLARDQAVFNFEDDGEEYDTECGLHCGGDDFVEAA